MEQSERIMHMENCLGESTAAVREFLVQMLETACQSVALNLR